MENIPIVEVIMGIVIAVQNVYLLIHKLFKKDK